MNLERRIRRAEERVGVKEEDRPVFIIGLEGGDRADGPDRLGPLDQWVTFRRARDDAKRAHLPLVFVVDPAKEHEARRERAAAPAATMGAAS